MHRGQQYLFLPVLPEKPITKGMFTGRKLSSVPRGKGRTGLCVEVTPDELRTVLEDLTEKFLVCTNYAGISGIEYKCDIHTGRFLIIEPTAGRTDWREEISTLSGINIPAIAYYEECNLPVPPSKRIPGVVWQQSYIDRMRSGLGVVPKKEVSSMAIGVATIRFRHSFTTHLKSCRCFQRTVKRLG